MTRRAKELGVVALAALAAAYTFTPVEAQTIAIRGATIHTNVQDPLDRGTVIIQDGFVLRVGRDAEIPAGARVIEGSGMVVTPGFIDSWTQLGLVEIGLSAEGTVDRSTSEPQVTASFNPVDGINPASTLIPIARVEGVTRAIVAPEPGASLIAGQGVLVDLGEGPVTAMLMKNPAAMFAVLGEGGAGLAGGARSAAAQQLREAIVDARDYAANRDAYDRGERRPYSLGRMDLEALVPVANREIPLVLEVNRASDILTALRLREELDLDMILSGVQEGWTVANEIAAARVPVLLNPLVNLPEFSSLAATYENAARLHRSGVTVVFASFDSHNSRNIKQAAGMAVSHGMPWAAALEAVTLRAAQVWGVDDRLGTIEPRRVADIVVWGGDPFELTTPVEHVFIEGREVSQETRQAALLRKYRDLSALPRE
jgi:imidazolonepropionase-like amidohydrolase